MVACAATRRAIVVDAGFEPDRIAAAVADVDPVAVLVTHGHADHVAAARPTADRLRVPVLMHPGDAAIAGFEPDRALEPGPIPVGDLTIDVVHTPGHTPGSICLLLSGVAITGDTLFPGGPGATRFGHSSFDAIIDSIASGLLTLEPSTLVMPGHGLDTTVGAEAPNLEEWRKRRW